MLNRFSLIAVALLMACSAAQRPTDAPDMLAEGQEAPALAAPDHNGVAVALRDGQVSLVYFYPKDNTPGCTREACAFRDVWQRFEDASVRVIGVSNDSAESHRQFAEEHELPFSLIADEENVWSDAFGVGRVLGMNRRVSFLIGAGGRVRKVYAEVDPGVHADQVLGDVSALGLTASP